MGVPDRPEDVLARRAAADRREAVGQRLVDDEVDLQALGGDLVQDSADLRSVALADLVDMPLGRDAQLERVPFLRKQARRREPVLILRPFNDLLEAGENLLPHVHGEEGTVCR